MKSIIIFIAFLCTINVQLSAQGIPEKITLGLYSAGGTPDINNDTQYVNYINNLGIDAAIHYVNNTVNPLLSNLDVISLNNSAQDFPFSYSQGYSSKWEAESIASTQEVGFKQSGGTYAGTTWRNNYNSNAELYGPRYEQEKKYREHCPIGGNWEFVTYKVKVKIRLTDFETPGNVCSIEIKYFHDKDSSGTVSDTEFDTLRTAEIFTTDSITTNWTVLELDYDYNNIVIETIPYKDLTAENDFGPGVQIEIKSLSSRGFEVDYVEFVDNTIWKEKYLERTTAFTTNLTNYVDSLLFDDVKYFYSQDEPHLFDQNVPYNTIKSAIENESGYKPLFTTFYPQWNRQFCGEPAYDWIDKFNSEQILFYYYPVISKDDLWNDSNYTYTEPTCPKPYFYLNNTMRHLEDATTDIKNENKNLWFTIQVHGHRNDNANILLRTPSTKEIRVQAMIALAHGMKGIFFYNMESYGEITGTRYNIGLASTDPSIVPNYKYYFLKNDLIPRIKNKYEQHLINLEYDNKYDKYFYIDPAIRIIDTTGYTHNDPNIALKLIDFDEDSTISRHVLVTQLNNDVNQNESIYYPVVNLITSEAFKDSQYIKYSYTIPQKFSDYRNIRFRDIGDQFDVTFDNSSQSTKFYNHWLLPGDGVIIQTGPVLKLGGTLVYNDTLNSNLTISEPITIESTATLTLNKVYTFAEDVYVEDGGMIETNLHGGIVLSSGAEMEFEDWSDGLVISQYDDHPKLYWTEHPTQEEMFKYEIYRKKDSESFQLIHTITNKTTTVYEDTEVDIMLTPGANETDAEYYVRTVVMPSRSWIEIDRTITVVLEHVEGSAQEKKSAEGIFITEYGLEQNRPNPFNPQTTITYQVPKASHVTLTVYDILGKVVFTLVDEIKGMGRYNLTFDASNLASGTYIYRMEAGKFVETKKMVLLK